MLLSKIRQEPIDLQDGGKRDVRTQFGALCYRVRNGDPQVLLVTSRESRRWIIPKGWPMDGETPADAAGTEAWEEAGVKGKVRNVCLGIYTYAKRIEGENSIPCVVAVFPVKVKSVEKNYPEKDQRTRKWFSLKKAAKLVDERDLGQIIKHFSPKHL
jgi:8-oxo-dGTP pyrophosphatase MutT (NUDIX family)